jgi:tetratricopeptide (TPR) repeat protein
VTKEHHKIGRREVNTRTERLEEAWGLGIQGYYDTALEILEDLLGKNPLDLGSLRLKGNLLELKEMDRLEYSGKKLISSDDYLAARKCYEKILEVEPLNIKALIDLGDHYRNLDANDRALEYYAGAARAAQSLQGKAPGEPVWKEDVEELCKAVALLTKHDRLAREARAIEAWCTQALEITPNPKGKKPGQ